MQERAAVARGATSIYVANVVVVVTNTLYFIVLTNILRSTLSVGILTALNLMIWLLVTLSILAQPVTMQSPVPAPPAVLKFVPEFLARKAYSAARRALSTSFLTSVVIAVLLSGVLVISPGFAIALLGGSIVPLLVQLSAADVILLVLGQVCLASLMSKGETLSASRYMILWSVLRYAAASVLLFTYSIEGVLIGWIIGDGLLVLVAIRQAFGTLHAGTQSSEFCLRDFMRYSSYTLLSALLGYIINQADKILTLAQKGLSELAIYNVAMAAASFAGLAPYVLTIALLPSLSSLHASHQVCEMREIVRQYSRYVSLMVIPIAMGLAASTEVALRIFGPAYVSGLLPSVIVSLASGLTAFGAVYAAALLAVGDLRWYTGANVVGVLGLGAVAYFATPLLGLSGPALGRATLMALAALLYAYSARRHGFLGFDARAFFSAAVGSIPMGAVIFVVLSLSQSFLMQLAMLPLVIVIGAFLYLLALRAVKSLNAQDFQFFQEMGPARLHKIVVLLARIAGVSVN